jgi:predicted amidophosphoribosyltransferase
VPISSTRVVHDYRGPVSRAVVTAKLGGAHAGWPALGRVLAAHVAADPPAVDVVTWVTTAPARRRRRGTDHAAVLAAAVGERIDVPVVPLLRVATHAGEERLRASRHLPGSEVLLVDDVLTTGATAVAAASELLRAGAGRIHLAVLARAGTHALVDGGQDGPGPHDPEGRGGPAGTTRSGGRKPSVGRTAGLDSPHAASGAPDGTHRR